MFASKTGELDKRGLVKHHINTEGQWPIRLRTYRIHQNYRSELEGILQELLANKIMTVSLPMGGTRSISCNAQPSADQECIPFTMYRL